MHTHIHTNQHTHKHTHTHTHAQIYTQTNEHTHTHTCEGKSTTLSAYFSLYSSDLIHNCGVLQEMVKDSEMGKR